MRCRYGNQTIFILGLLVLFRFGCPALRAQIKISPKPSAQSGLTGTWVLTRIDLASGQDLTDGMKVNLEHTRMVFEGEANGRIVEEDTELFSEAGKPAVKCLLNISGTFTVARLEGNSYLRTSPGSLAPNTRCNPYPTQDLKFPAHSSMFDLNGDTLTTFSYGGGDGVLIQTFARAKPGPIQIKNPFTR